MILFVFAGILILALLLTIPDQGWRKASIQAYWIFSALILVITELLSLNDAITRPALIAAWGLAGAGLLLALVFRILKRKIPIRDLIPRGSRSGGEPFSKLEILAIAVIGIILLTTLVIALAAPPNNFDSMTYHMARVSNWIQNQSIRYYPTAIDRQNYSAPLAEYLILHLQILSRSDSFANLVQWTAFALLILLTAELAAALGISRRGQLFAALFAATIPMAILQSTSTQNDLLTALGCLSFAYFLQRMIQRESLLDGIFAGLSLGAAILTKGTAYLFCAGVGIPLALTGLFDRKKGKRSAMAWKLTLIIVIGLVMNLGVYQRNWVRYRHPLSTGSAAVRSDQLSPAGLALNLARNGLVQLAVPFESANRQMTRLMEIVFPDLNQDPRFLFANSEFDVIFTLDGDLASNLPHFLILTFGILAFPWLRKRSNLGLDWLVSALVLSTALFSLTIKWQPWGSRLQLTLYFLGVPLFGYLVDRIKPAKSLSHLLVIGLALYSIPYLVLNSSRPMVPLLPEKSPLRMDRVISNSPLIYELFSDLVQPYYADTSIFKTERKAQYFTPNLRIYPDYAEVLAAVADLELQVIGLELEGNSWEYPIWVYLDRHAETGAPRILHVGKDIDLAGERPEYVLSAKGEASYFIQELDYIPVVDTKYLDLLRR